MLASSWTAQRDEHMRQPRVSKQAPGSALARDDVAEVTRPRAPEPAITASTTPPPTCPAAATAGRPAALVTQPAADTPRRLRAGLSTGLPYPATRSLLRCNTRLDRPSRCPVVQVRHSGGGP